MKPTIVVRGKKYRIKFNDLALSHFDDMPAEVTFLTDEIAWVKLLGAGREKTLVAASIKQAVFTPLTSCKEMVIEKILSKYHQHQKIDIDTLSHLYDKGLLKEDV